MPGKVPGGGFPTQYTHLCLVHNMKSELIYFPICTTNESSSISAKFQLTGSTSLHSK